MTQQTKRPNLLPYLLVLLVLVGVYGFMNKPVEAEPSYAEVRELFESEQVSAFTVTDTTLRMKLREPIDGKTELKKDLFSVTLFYDDLGELIEQQKADGIIEDYDFTADHSINYVAMFAPYILAVLGIFAIWYFLSVRSAGGGGGALPPDCPICCDRFCAMFITCAMASGSESRVFSFSSHSLIVTPSRGFYFFALSLMRFIMAMPSGLFIRFESIVANSFVLPAAAFCAA